MWKNRKSDHNNTLRYGYQTFTGNHNVLFNAWYKSSSFIHNYELDVGNISKLCLLFLHLAHRLLLILLSVSKENKVNNELENNSF